jgi:hypothetical protein
MTKIVRSGHGIRRLGLVIGNDGYPGNPLHDAVNDARSNEDTIHGTYNGRPPSTGR